MDALVQTIHSESNDYPPPTLCTVKKVHEDNKHIDIELKNGGVLEYINTIGIPSVNKEGVVLYLDGDYNSPIVIV